MEITKKEGYYLFTNKEGEYHISYEKYDLIGKEEAIELAEKEIKLKNKANYSNRAINFKQARKLGFCEYGIKDFCEKLELNIEEFFS